MFLTTVFDINKEVPIKHIAKTAVVDMDSVSYHVAAAAETPSIIVTHKEAGWSEEFKNRTVFKGRAKKNIGGWLADQNETREANELEPFAVEDFEIVDHYVAEPVENALYSVKQKIKSIKERCKELVRAEEFILLMGEGDSHRSSLKLPRKYKSNRDDLHRPILLKGVRDYCHKHQGTRIVTGIEADDALCMYGYKGWQDWKKTGKFSYCQVTEDKDSMQTNGLIINPRKKDTKWIYDEPFLIDGLGSLYRNEKGDVKGSGFAWLMYQTFGDKCDGYDCTYLTNKRYGFADVSRYETLKDCITPTEYLQTVLDKYTELFGDRVQYEAWDGTEMDIPIVEYIEMHFCCCYMLRNRCDTTTFKGLCRKYGVKIC